jgi:hypothetical protein
VIASVLSFLASLFSALPKVLEMVGEWQKNRAKAAKDERNAKAISDARSMPPGE